MKGGVWGVLRVRHHTPKLSVARKLNFFVSLKFLEKLNRLRRKEGLFVVYNNNNYKNHVYQISFDNGHDAPIQWAFVPQSTTDVHTRFAIATFITTTDASIASTITTTDAPESFTIDAPINYFFVLRWHWHPLMTDQHYCPNHFVERGG